MFKEFRDAVLVQLGMPLSLTELTEKWPLFGEYFAERRKKRPRQLQRIQKL
jgi:hypothetical protein